MDKLRISDELLLNLKRISELSEFDYMLFERQDIDMYKALLYLFIGFQKLNEIITRCRFKSTIRNNGTVFYFSAINHY